MIPTEVGGSIGAGACVGGKDVVCAITRDVSTADISRMDLIRGWPLQRRHEWYMSLKC